MWPTDNGIRVLFVWPTDGGIRVQRQTGGGESSSVILTIYRIFYVCDPEVAKGVTRDPTVETAVV